MRQYRGISEILFDQSIPMIEYIAGLLPRPKHDYEDHQRFLRKQPHEGQRKNIVKGARTGMRDTILALELDRGSGAGHRGVALT